MLIEEDILTLDEIGDISEYISLFEPLTKDQNNFLLSLKRIRWLFGGNQSGKSYLNMMDLCMQALEVHPTRPPIPNGIHWVGIESWEMVREILWDQYLLKFIPPHRIVHIDKGQLKEPRRIFLDNGHVIHCKAFNQGRSLFQGKAIHTFHGDEQCPSDFMGVLQEIEARLLLYNGEISWSMTPIKPQIDLEELIEDLPPTSEAFYLNLEDNRKSRGGYIEDTVIDEKIDGWSEGTKITRMKGRFSSYLGSVFTAYQRSVHVIEPFKIPEDWKRYRGIDFGWNNPFACLWIAESPDSRFYVYNEHYKSREFPDYHINEIKRISKNERYVLTVADSEDPQDIAYMNTKGLQVVGASKPPGSVREGVEILCKLFETKKNGHSDLYIFNTCKNLIKEVPVYHWSEKIKGEVVAENDHCISALRYVLYLLKKPRKKGKVVIAG